MSSIEESGHTDSERDPNAEVIKGYFKEFEKLAKDTVAAAAEEERAPILRDDDEPAGEDNPVVGEEACSRTTCHMEDVAEENWPSVWEVATFNSDLYAGICASFVFVAQESADEDPTYREFGFQLAQKNGRPVIETFAHGIEGDDGDIRGYDAEELREVTSEQKLEDLKQTALKFINEAQ